MDEFIEFGFFQLENLFLNPSRFLFLDLRTNRSPTVPAVDRLLKTAEPVNAPSVKNYVVAKKVDREFPVVLVCAEGHDSKIAAADLSKAGYINIYVVAGGVAGLLSEA